MLLKYPISKDGPIPKCQRGKWEKCFWPYLLMSMTIVVIMAARNTKPPNTPKAIIPPSNKLRKSENMWVLFQHY